MEVLVQKGQAALLKADEKHQKAEKVQATLPQQFVRFYLHRKIVLNAASIEAVELWKLASHPS
jgi:hypothetical protein